MTLKAPNAEPVPYDGSWPDRFGEMAAAVREALGAHALRIDHVGPTAVLGTRARPVVSIQVSVDSLDEVTLLEEPLEALGYAVQPTPDHTMRLFGRPVDGRATITVRAAGSFGEQRALLLRDYLRTHPGTSKDRELDDDDNDDTWELLRAADAWAQGSGWKPKPTDA